MAVNLSPVGGVAGQFFDNNGDPLVGGKLYTYAAGTTTPQTTYTSSLGTTPNSNPIILNAGGRVPSEIWLTDGLSYKFVLYTSTDQLVGSWDDISGINSNFVNFTSSQEIQTATSGQTVFTLTTMEYQPGTNSLTVYVDGVNQYGPGAQYAYVETNSTTVTFNAGLHVGAEVKFTTVEQATSSATDAASVAYTPAGTGAVTTNVQAKLRETVSVKDFGAVGDGVTDDTAAIQAAIDYASGLGGYTKIIFAPGVTYLTERLVPKSGVLLNLQGATLKLADNTNLPILYDGVSVGSDFGLINGTLDCNQDFNKASSICGGLWLNEWTNVEAKNLTIKNCNRVGLYFFKSTQVIIENYNFIDSGTATATAPVKFSYALGIGLTTTTGDNCNNIVVKNIKASNLYGYGILVIGSTNISIENVDFDNFFFPTASIGITLSESFRINVNNVKLNDIIGDNFEINGCEDVVVNSVEINNAGIRPVIIGQNTPGTFNKRLMLSNFKITATGSSYSVSLSQLFDSTLTNFNCDKGVSGISFAGTSGNNCVTDSIFPVTSPAIFLNYGFYRLENVKFSDVTYQFLDRYSARVSGVAAIAASGVFNLDMATLFPNFMTVGSRVVTGKLSIQNAWTGSLNQGSYQSCEFLVSDFGTAANLSAVTTVNNAVARALTIAGDAANKRITLTNGTAVDLQSAYVIDLVVPV